jgi:hypothetical protein
LRLMTTFKLAWLLIVSVLSFSSYSSTSSSWDVLLLENQSNLNSVGYFVSADDHFYYLGFKFTQQDSLDAEFAFLMAFQDRISELVTQQCERSQSLLSSSYKFDVSFAKTVVEQVRGTVFITSVSKQIIRQEALYACTK